MHDIQPKPNDVPVFNIPIINRDTGNGSHYAFVRELSPGEKSSDGTRVVEVHSTGKRYALESSVHLELDSREIEGAPLEGIYEFHADKLDPSVAEGMKRLGAAYEKENSGQTFGLLEEREVNGKKEYNIFFDEEFRTWVMQQEDPKEKSFFGAPLQKFLLSYVSNGGVNVRSASETALLRIFLPDNTAHYAHWPDHIGSFDKREMLQIVQRLKQSLTSFFNVPGIGKDISRRVEVHEEAHYLSTELLFGDAFRDIVLLFDNIDTAAQDTKKEFGGKIGPDLEIKERMRMVTEEYDRDKEVVKRFNVVSSLMNKLEGLSEAYSMVHEIAGTLLISKDAPKDMNFLIIRASKILSEFKFDPITNNKNPDLAKTVNGSEEMKFEAHDLGALILLTNGSFLSMNDATRIFAQPSSKSIDNDYFFGQIRALSEDPKGFANGVKLEELKPKIEIKLFDLLVQLISEMSMLKQHIENLPQDPQSDNVLRSTLRDLSIKDFSDVRDKLKEESVLIEKARQEYSQ
jgi:hypothetical protein